MSDGKIHIPARRKQPVDDQMVVKVTPEAYNALVEIYNESTLSLKQIASLLIVKAAEQRMAVTKSRRECDRYHRPCITSGSNPDQPIWKDH